MTATSNIEIAGIKDAIRSLNKIEPGLRKEFQQEAARIAQPAIEEAQRGYVGVIVRHGVQLVKGRQKTVSV